MDVFSEAVLNALFSRISGIIKLKLLLCTIKLNYSGNVLKTKLHRNVWSILSSLQWRPKSKFLIEHRIEKLQSV